MPDPKQDENKDPYLQRCMSDTESVRDFPEATQRYAFCQSKWDQGLKEEAVTAGGAVRRGEVAEEVGRKRKKPKGKKYMSLAELRLLMPGLMTMDHRSTE